LPALAKCIHRRGRKTERFPTRSNHYLAKGGVDQARVQVALTLLFYFRLLVIQSKPALPRFSISKSALIGKTFDLPDFSF
jgi:hypothetical protein